MSGATLNVVKASHAPAIEVTTIAAITKRIIPYFLLLYAVAYLDRINISYAALTMNSEIGMSEKQFGFSASIFFIGYFLFEVPSNAAFSRFGARRWLSRIMISWGIVAVATGFVQDVTHLYVARFLLGAMEAGFFPGAAFYLTFWFPRRYRARAMASFLSAQILCSLIGAPISGLIMDYISWFGLSGWRWTIILEGIPAILLGIHCQKYLDSDPSEATWLSSEQKSWLQHELRTENRIPTRRHVAWWRHLANPHVVYLSATYIFIVTAVYGVAFWAPTIIKGLRDDFSNTAIGFLLMIPTLVGGAAMWINGWHSDKTMERRWHVIGVVLIGAAGCFALTLSTNVWLSIVCVSCISVASYGYLGAWWALPTGFLSGPSAAIGLAAINSIGNLGGFLGPNVVGILVSSTGDQRTGLIFLGASFIVGAGLLVLFQSPQTHSLQPSVQ